MDGEPEMVQCLNPKHPPQDLRIQRNKGYAVFWDEEGKAHVQCQHDPNCFVPIPDESFVVAVISVEAKKSNEVK